MMTEMVKLRVAVIDTSSALAMSFAYGQVEWPPHCPIMGKYFVFCHKIISDREIRHKYYHNFRKTYEPFILENAENFIKIILGTPFLILRNPHVKSEMCREFKVMIFFQALQLASPVLRGKSFGGD